MTIEKLIDALKNDGISAYGVLEDWFNGFHVTEESEILEERYNTIYGFIWGLIATEYITVKESLELRTNLLNMYRERLYEIN